jgi:ketosteroid isomerase-like protein
MDNRTILDTIDRFWAARQRNDAAAIQGFFAPGATFEMVGAGSFADRETVGPAMAASAADRLVADFKLKNRKLLSAVVDGQKAAVINKLKISFRDNAPVDSECCDFWEFDADGKAISLRQFVDTDLVRRMIAGVA